ncbi:MAG: methyl-accepting chemotaxis protein [Lachnospiraceae bacterium]|nr:methyl-accepting chemotaxis protein [Lachnospiraceae bacterium]
MMKLKLPKTEKVKEPKAPKATKEKKVKVDKKGVPKETKGRFNLHSVAAKMMMLTEIPILFICLILAVFSISKLQASIEEQIEKSLKIVASSVNETYTSLYEGDYAMEQGGTVTKGGVTLTGETQLIDALKEKTDFDVSFIFERSRMITTLRRDGGPRINGTSADKSVYAKTETGEEVFLKGIDISGTNYYAYYQPIYNSDGSVIGTIEVCTRSAEVKSLIGGQTVQIALVSVVLAVLAGALVWIMSQRMVVTMKSTKHFLQKIMNGKLDNEAKAKHVGRRDELGDIYRIVVKLQDTLRIIMDDIKESSENMIQSADKLTNVAQTTGANMEDVNRAMLDITEGAKSQAVSVNEADDNIQSMDQQIRLITEEVEQLADYAEEMADAEKASEAITEELAQQGLRTKDAVGRVAKQIQEMNQSVQSIIEAVTIIQTIADETDLLSLNASIEAARAGEAGRGFAVVAEQISKLADQSNRSAQDIENLLTSVGALSDQVTEIMSQLEESVEVQQQKLDETKVKYAAVASGVENSLTNIETIKGKMEMLRESGEAILDIMRGLAAISEENAASADNTLEVFGEVNETMGELNTSSMDLVELADKLQEAVAVFK